MRVCACQRSSDRNLTSADAEQSQKRLIFGISFHGVYAGRSDSVNGTNQSIELNQKYLAHSLKWKICRRLR